VGIRCADHATPSICKKLALTSPKSGGRLVGIVRLRTKSNGVQFFFLVQRNVPLPSSKSKSIPGKQTRKQAIDCLFVQWKKNVVCVFRSGSASSRQYSVKSQKIAIFIPRNSSLIFICTIPSLMFRPTQIYWLYLLKNKRQNIQNTNLTVMRIDNKINQSNIKVGMKIT
jgi:hypothetical protein